MMGDASERYMMVLSHSFLLYANKTVHLPTQNETGEFCKALIIMCLELNFEGQILCRGTEWGRKNDKKRQFLPHKKQRMITNDNTICRFLSYIHFLTLILSFVVPFLRWSLSLQKILLSIVNFTPFRFLSFNADFMLLLSFPFR